MPDLNIVSIPQVAAVFLEETRIRTHLAGVGGLTPGTPVYTSPLGTALPTNASDATKVSFRGIASVVAGPGQACDIIEEGFVAGFDLSALPYDAPVYLSNTPGKLATTAGATSVIVGRVVPLSDRDPATGGPSKILFVRPSYN